MPHLHERLQRALDGTYQIERELVGGGMSRLFLASEISLDRLVVIKLLPPDLVNEVSAARFHREITLTAHLQHPHILPVLSAGACDGLLYYVMPYSAGESLRQRLERGGRLPTPEALQVLRDVTDALAYAHRHGVVHRDVKPANVLLMEGEAMLADFGVARAVEEASATAVPVAASAERLTGAGAVVGTPGYMAPEQMIGEPRVDARADVYAAAAVGYEMLTGERLFRGASAHTILAAQLTVSPDRLASLDGTVPRELKACLLTALAADPASRYPTAVEFRDALDAANAPAPRRIVSQGLGWRERAPYLALGASAAPLVLGAGAPGGRARRGLARVALAAMVVVLATLGGSLVWRARAAPAPAAAERSVAVLPFQNVGADPTTAYFADGMTEGLIAALSEVGGLRVAARTSSFVFRRPDVDVREIGRKLAVATVLEGSVQKEGARLRVTSRLVDARDGSILWSASHDRTLDDVFTVQDEIARAIVRALQPRLGATPGTVAPMRTPRSTDAYLLYLQGRHAWHQRTRADVARAVQLFERAIAKDSLYAPAWAGLADAYVVQPAYAPQLPIAPAYERAEAAARRALALDSTLAEPHATIGFVRMRLYDWRGANDGFARALARNPNYATGHQWYGKALAAQGRLREGEAELRRALALNPLSAVTGYNLGQILFWQRRYPAALEQLRATLEVNASFYQARSVMGLVRVAQGEAADGVVELRRVIDAQPERNPDDVALLAYAHAVAGARDSAAALLAEVRTRADAGRVSPADVALVYVGLGRYDEAFGWLDRARRTYDSDIQAFVWAPMLDPLRADPRFARLLRAMHLPPVQVPAVATAARGGR